jgi:hypothetical protein
MTLESLFPIMNMTIFDGSRGETIWTTWHWLERFCLPYYSIIITS